MDLINQKRSRNLAKDLLEIEAVFLRPDEPFTWASGIMSPIYCDNRLTLSDPQVRLFIETAISSMVYQEFPECEMLMGTSTAGIAHAAIAAHLLDMPMGYVRGSAKDHGRNNRIEGKMPEGTKVVVIEDLISTASSAIDTAEALREAGGEVLGICSIFTYGMKAAEENLKAAGLVNFSLSNFDDLVDVAVEEGYIKESDKARLLAFRENPKDASWQTL